MQEDSPHPASLKQLILLTTLLGSLQQLSSQSHTPTCSCPELQQLQAVALACSRPPHLHTPPPSLSTHLLLQQQLQAAAVAVH